MKVENDIIAAVQGPGWRYGLSRIVIADGQGAVFIAGSQTPFAFFTPVTVGTSKGSGTSPEGDITWRRRGSSCQYKLAKCKVSTETMLSWFEAALAEDEPEPEPAEETAETLL